MPSIAVGTLRVKVALAPGMATPQWEIKRLSSVLDFFPFRKSSVLPD